MHPAAKSLVDIARSQDSEVGDGTTTVVILAGEFLRECKPFVEDGVHPQNIIKSFREAARTPWRASRARGVHRGQGRGGEGGAPEEVRDDHASSKLVGGEKEFFARCAWTR